MPKLATFKYPELNIEDALKLAKAIYDRVQGGRLSRASIHSAIGRSRDEKQLDQILEDLQGFGLLEIAGPIIKQTQLLEDLAAASSEIQYTAVIMRMMLNVPLYRVLNESLAKDSQQTEDEFALALQLLTGAAEKTVRRHVEPVRTRFLDIARQVRR